MFATFKMNLTEFKRYISTDYDRYKEIGKGLIHNYTNQIKESVIADYAYKDGAINASEIEQDWFPSINADVFISHSHKDENDVVAFAGYLEELGLRTFVDSSVWRYSDDLLRIIDNEYCVDEDDPNLYSYKKRNYSTTQVHLILNSALMKMMNKTECLIFLNTPNSLMAQDIKTGKTNSAWIYSEILMSSLIKREVPERFITRTKKFSMDESLSHGEMADFIYNVNISHLIDLSLADIINASTSENYGLELLNELYKKKNLINPNIIIDD